MRIPKNENSQQLLKNLYFLVKIPKFGKIAKKNIKILAIIFFIKKNIIKNVFLT